MSRACLTIASDLQAASRLGSDRAGAAPVAQRDSKIDRDRARPRGRAGDARTTATSTRRSCTAFERDGAFARALGGRLPQSRTHLFAGLPGGAVVALRGYQFLHGRQATLITNMVQLLWQRCWTLALWSCAVVGQLPAPAAALDNGVGRTPALGWSR